MASQFCFFRSLVLGIIGICIITYSSFYGTIGYFYMKYDGIQTKSSPVSLPTLPSLNSHQFNINVVENGSTSINKSGTSHSSLFAVLSQEFLKAAKSSSKSAPPAATNAAPQHLHLNNVTPSDGLDKGFLTSDIYEPGYEITSSELCPDFGSNLKLLVVITSAPSHNEARMAIRQTWGHYSQRSDISIAFFLGSTSNKQLNEAIRDEYHLYNDIVSAKFVDSYNNLTLKTVSMLQWVDIYCNQSSFVLKTDDDMFINIPKLLTFVDKHFKDKRTIFGRLAKKWKPIRNKKSKYFISLQQFSPSVFPDFTTGPAYLMTGDVIHDLYTHTLQKTYLKLEDVFVTGIVAQDLKIKRSHVNEFLNKRISFNPCNIQKGISIHMVKFHEQFDLWKKLLDGRMKCK
ncbi:beta-1,3-galactosyltransferase 5-like isoform X2 [Bacillus rossius redtenbacheri]|uniref:beta-1,3-galactosyltransferase 5-like isoform X2 n=1 Tax=Bacillus rossius redtenbacheri TaxID=93214 RepID=UPI002FDEFF32